MSSEIYSYLYEEVLKQGALDIYTQSIYMKKNRPATKVSILCSKKDLQRFIDLLLVQTSTFGIRYTEYKRQILNRRFKKVNTPYGVISVKLGYHNDKLIKVTPEYEDCKIISQNQGIPLNILIYNINSIINKEFNINLLT